MNPLELYEAYSAVYDEDLRDQILDEDYDIIDELTDEELEDIVEEVIYDLLDEGYSINDVDLIFESEEIYDEILCEATVTSDETRPTSSKAEVTSGTGTRRVAAARLARMKAGQKIERQKARKKRIQRAISKVKGGIKGAIKSGVSVARAAVDEPARKYAEKRGVVPSKSGKTSLGSGEGIGSVKFKQKTSAGRREVRSRVAGDIASRIKGKVQRGAEKLGKALTSPARGGSGGGTSVSGRVGQAASAVATRAGEVGTAAKRGLRGALLGAARKLREDEEFETVDLYDIVLEHLLDEGYADTEEAATVIMANMSEEWRDSIIEEAEQSSMPPRRSAAERKKRAKELGDRQTIRGIVSNYNKKRQPSRQEDPEKYYSNN
jgi:hypothetical protein